MKQRQAEAAAQDLLDEREEAESESRALESDEVMT